MINILDEKTISKIAAGEIIENPASIVKELIENSIDAEAKNIFIELKKEATDYIRISDDGLGMNKSDLNLAFLRHTTSKLKTAEDLNKIHSLGFRGEALASIAHIAKVEAISKSENDKVGSGIVLNNGEIIKNYNVGVSRGTTIFVKDIFYNTPVRKKYLKENKIELSYIYEVVSKIALSKPEIAFKLVSDNKVILNTNATDNYKNHIFSILGRDIAENLIKIDYESEKYKISGFISNNKLYRSSRNNEYVFMNGRYIKNLEIARSVEKNYKSLIPLNRFPVFILYIEIPPDMVDVNIHPKKHEIKLSKENHLTTILSEIVEDKLFSNRSVISVDYTNEKTEEEKTIFDLNINDEEDSDLEIEKFESKEKNQEYLQRENEIHELNIFVEDFNKNFKVEDEKEEYFTDDEEDKKSEDLNEKLYKQNDLTYKLLKSDFVGVLFNTFIIMESLNSDKFFLIDQHAAHERINYEKFKNQYEKSEVITQLLLKPIIINIDESERRVFINSKETLNKLGFEMEEFGENSLILREIPVLFKEPEGENFIHDLLRDPHDNLYKVDPYRIMRKACKASIKAGDKISSLEVDGLIKSLIKCQTPYTCPHGRPTVIEITKSRIERLFLRE